MSKPIFISYSTDDAPSAAAIRDGLEHAGLLCWMAPRDIVPGADYAEQILGAIEACAVMVLVLSETSNQSRYVRNEVERAIAKDKTVIPVRIHNVMPARSLEFFVSNAQWIDAWEGTLSSAIAALAAAIGKHGVKLETTPAASTHDSPAAVTSAPSRGGEPVIVGRVKERAELRQLLILPTTRLVTLLGPGGIGKSTLATTVAASLRAHFPDGVFEVALAALTQGEQIYAAIADAMGLKTTSELPLPPQLFAHLAGKRSLLVLDNVEQLADGAVQIMALLDGAPDTRILTTSRERLNLSAEVLFRLEGLLLPSEDADSANESVALFLRHAQRVAPNLVVAGRALAEISRICRLVSGTPLAIVLAASSADALTLQEIGDEVGRSLDVLETEMHDLPARQRSMRGVLDSTWNRLSAAEQQAFAGLSLFRGGFTREAALAVTGMNVRTLVTLNGKSLVSNDQGRYAIHELLRQFGTIKLTESGGRHAAEAAFAGYFLKWLTTRETALQNMETGVVGEIGLDFENVRQAWSIAVEANRFGALDACLASLMQYCKLRGRMPDVHELLSAAIAKSDGSRYRARLIAQRSYANEITGAFAQEIDDSEMALKSSDAIWSPREVIWLLNRQGFAFRRLGKFHQAQAVLEHALAQCQRAGDAHAEADTLFHLGQVEWSRGNRVQSLALMRRSSAIVEEHNYTDVVAVQAAYGLAEQYNTAGDAIRAIPLLESALRIARLAHDTQYEQDCLQDLGLILGVMAKAEWDGSIRYLNEAVSLAEHTGRPHAAHFSYWGLGYACLWLGDIGRALENAEECRRSAILVGSPFVEASAVMCRADVMCALGLYELALADLDHARKLLDAINTTLIASQILSQSSTVRIRMGAQDGAMLTELERTATAELAQENFKNWRDVQCALCEFHFSSRDFEATSKSAQELLEFARAQQHHGAYAQGLVWLGKSQIELGGTTEGLASLREALAFAQANRYHWVQIDAHRALQRAFADQGDGEKSAQHRSAAEALIDQIRVNLKDRPELQAGLHTL